MNPFIQIDKKNPFLSESDEDSPPRLPPRPSSINLLSEKSSNNSGPPLPQRPSALNLHSFGSEPTLRTDRHLSHMSSVDRLVALSLKEPVSHPDSLKSTRNLPRASGHSSHKGYVKCWDISSNYIVTGSTNIRVFNIYSGENSKTIPLGESKPSSVAFVPTRPFQEEDTVWVGCEKGELLEISIGQGKVISKRSLHSTNVTSIIKFKKRFLITIDEQGALKIWTELDSRGLINLHARPRGLRIHSKLGQLVDTVSQKKI